MEKASRKPQRPQEEDDALQLVVLNFLGDLEEVLDILFWCADKHAVAQVQDVPGALGLLDGVLDALCDGLLGAKQDAWVDVALQQTSLCIRASSHMCCLHSSKGLDSHR